MHHHDRSQASKKITLIGGIIDLALALGKIIVGLLSHAQSLVADGIHSLSDLLTDILVWVTASHANEAPDAQHPYGHGRFETLATLGLGVFLCLVGIGIIYHAITKPAAEALTLTWLALTVALVSVLAKEALYHATCKVAEQIHSPMLKANAWHHRTDSLSSIVVLVGIAGTALGYPYFDTIAAIVVGLMIIKIAWELGKEAFDELADTALNPEQTQALIQAMQAVPGVEDVQQLRTRKMSHQIYADVKITLDAQHSVQKAHRIAQAAHQAAKQTVPTLHDIVIAIQPGQA